MVGKNYGKNRQIRHGKIFVDFPVFWFFVSIARTTKIQLFALCTVYLIDVLSQVSENLVLFLVVCPTTVQKFAKCDQLHAKRTSKQAWASCEIIGTRMNKPQWNSAIWKAAAEREAVQRRTVAACQCQCWFSDTILTRAMPRHPSMSRCDTTTTLHGLLAEKTTLFQHENNPTTTQHENNHTCFTWQWHETLLRKTPVNNGQLWCSRAFVFRLGSGGRSLFHTHLSAGIRTAFLVHRAFPCEHPAHACPLFFITFDQQMTDKEIDQVDHSHDGTSKEQTQDATRLPEQIVYRFLVVFLHMNNAG